MKVKTRFAPSPTGFIHLGNARTALHSFLYAKSRNGHFLLRMEDTDIERSDNNLADALQVDLKWLGINWEEGVGIKGEHAPYYQAERLPIYEKFYQILVEKRLAYPCFCTEEQLALSRKLQRARGMAPRYAGTCYSLSKEEVQKKVDQGLKPALRFHAPNGTHIVFDDVVKGRQQFNVDDMGDFIIRRSNLMPSFMFCNAIDDSLMEVTHAIRGEDHLTNTPRQVMILQALNLRVPQYGHISLILGMDGAPLSKRNGSRSIRDLQEIGYLPLAIVNHLARLGHYYENNALMTLKELSEQFKAHMLSKSPARYDEAQLTHWQKLAIEQLDDEAFWQWAGSDIKKNMPEDKQVLFVKTIKPNVLFPQDVHYWADLFFAAHYEMPADKLDFITAAGKVYYKEAQEVAKKTGINAKLFFNDLKGALNVNGKALYMPVRLALTGSEHGPEMEAIFQLLGEEKVIERFKKAYEVCS